MSSTAQPDVSTSDEAADAPHPTRSVYDRDLLREQIEILRREAAVRSRLENEIQAEFDATVETVRSRATAALAACDETFTGQIAATKKEYAALLQKADAFLAAERKKLDDQRAAVAKKIGRDCDTLLKQAQEEEQFEEGSFREVFKEKKKDPLRLYAKGEKDLARAIAAIEDAKSRVTSSVATRGVDVAVAEPAAAELAESDDAAQVFERLRASVDEQAKAILGLPEAARAFNGGLQAVVIALDRKSVV